MCVFTSAVALLSSPRKNLIHWDQCIFTSTPHISDLCGGQKRKSSSDSQCVLWRWDAMGISQNGTQYRCLCFLVNYFTKKRQQLYPSDYSKFLSNPATCYIPLQRHQVAVRRPFLIKSWTILFFKSYVGKAGNSFKLAPILPSMMCSCQFVVLPLEIALLSP